MADSRKFYLNLSGFTFPLLMILFRLIVAANVELMVLNLQNACMIRLACLPDAAIVSVVWIRVLDRSVSLPVRKAVKPAKSVKRSYASLHTTVAPASLALAPVYMMP